jgi:inorganic pyrophosphatase
MLPTTTTRPDLDGPRQAADPGRVLDAGPSLGVSRRVMVGVYQATGRRCAGGGDTKRGMEIVVVVEIPKGTRNKYEMDDDGKMWLDRTLFTSNRYPEDYGFVPETHADDGDPLDALVLLDEPTFPGCHLRARPIGMFEMSDEEGVDTKLLCVPVKDSRWTNVQEISDVHPHTLDVIAHFFTVYKDLEPGKSVQPGGWTGRAEAEALVEKARQAYQAL